jgi:hypothetical protein
MAVTIYGMKAETFVPLEFTSRVGTEWPNEEARVWPYPVQGGVRALYVQKCVDTVTNDWTYWATYYQDIYGNEYPGAGFDSATYKVESISHTREQV